MIKIYIEYAQKIDAVMGICYRDFPVDKEIAHYLRLRSIVRYTLLKIIKINCNL